MKKKIVIEIDEKDQSDATVTIDGQSAESPALVLAFKYHDKPEAYTYLCGSLKDILNLAVHQILVINDQQPKVHQEIIEGLKNLIKSLEESSDSDPDLDDKFNNIINKLK